jgi:hypothetical protein
MKNDDEIRERAYYLWLEAGCPDDSAEEFWARAEASEGNEYLRAVEDGSF